MNPNLEVRWPDALTRLIAYISDALSQSLLPDPPLHEDELAWLDARRTDAGLIN